VVLGLRIDRLSAFFILLIAGFAIAVAAYSLGTRGMGEMPYLPAAAVVSAAVYDATGVRFDELPLTPERMWRGLQGKK
jgi:CO/xanthine dehydrogenase Mo-binding subunit